MEYQEIQKKNGPRECDSKEKENIDYDYNKNYEVQTTTTIYVSIGTRSKEHTLETLKGAKKENQAIPTAVRQAKDEGVRHHA